MDQEEKIIETEEVTEPSAEALENVALRDELEKTLSEMRAMKEEVAKIKASNAKLLLQVNAASTATASFEEALTELFLRRK